MKQNGKYRFSLQFKADSNANIAAGELLERLGNRKSAVVVAALNDYISVHPEIAAGATRISVRIEREVKRESLEEMIRALIDEKIAALQMQPNAAPPYIDEQVQGNLSNRTRLMDADGRRVALYAQTPEELYEKVREAQRRIEEAVFRKTTPTVAEYCARWLIMQSGKVRATTLADYTSKVKNYIVAPLGRMRMADVTSDDIKMAMVNVSDKSTSVYRSVQMLFKSIFYSAFDSKIIDTCPCERLPSKGGKEQKPRVPLTDDQVERLIAAIKGLPPYVFVMIGLYAGLRREEILALKWDCVILDTDAPYIAVRRAWHTEHNRPVISEELKTKSARREVPMPAKLADCLRAAKACSASEYVVASQEGEPLSYTQFKRLWQYIVTRSTRERTYVRYINGQKIKHTVVKLSIRLIFR